MIKNREGIFFSFIIYLAFPLLLTGQVRIEPSPAWAQVYEVNSDFKADKNKISGGYYTLMRCIQNNIPAKTQDYQEAIHVFNSTGVENQSDINLVYDPSYERVHFHRIALIRNGKYIDKSGEITAQYLDIETHADQLMYDGRKSILFHLPDVHIDDIIYLHYSVEGQNPVFAGQFENAVNFCLTDTMDRYVITYLCAPGEKLNYHLVNSALPPVEDHLSSFIKYTWDLHHVRSFKQEYYPGWYNPYPGVEVSTFSSWIEVRDWAKPLFALNDKPDEAFTNYIQGLNERFPKINDRITAAIRWVQNEVRYLGLEFNINSHQPADPISTFHRRHGDCKDKSFLLCKILNTIGVEAFPVLVNSSETYSLPTRLPGARVFDHCIVGIDYEGKRYFIDPTINDQGGVFPDIHVPGYAFGLSLNAEGDALDTISSPTKPSVTTFEEFFAKGMEGGKLQVTTIYSNGAADDQRAKLKSNAPANLLEDYQVYYEKLYDGVKSIGDLHIDDDTITNVITTEENYSIERFWLKPDSTDTKSAHLMPIKGSTIMDYLSAAPDESYVGPVSLYFPYEVQHSVTVHLPKKWSLNLENEQKSMKGISFTSAFNLEKDSIVHCRYNLKITEPSIDSSLLNQYRTLRKEVEDASYFVLQEYNPGSSFSRALFPFLISLLSLCACLFFWKKLYRWDPEPTNEFGMYDSIGGWLVFPLMGICLSPFIQLFQFFNNEFFSPTVWNLVFSNGNTWHYLPLSMTLTFELIISIIQICFTIQLIVLFLQRRTSVPNLAIIFYGGTLMIVLLDLLAVEILKTIYPETDFDTADQTKQVLRSFIATLIWVPYFHYSDRVASTFTVRLAIKEVDEVEPPPLPPPLPGIPEE